MGNKSIATEAGRKFPACVSAKTSHALAHQAIRQWQPDLMAKMRMSRVPFSSTASALDIRQMTVQSAGGRARTLSQYQITRQVMHTVSEFCKTADAEISWTHVPAVVGLDSPGSNTSHREFADRIVPHARALWADLTNPAGGAAKFDHGHYLKMWALARPIIGEDGSAVFLDEAQDTSPVLQAVLADQHHLQIVYVGDSAQAIYCQPVGTMVTVPKARPAVDAERACAFEGCGRARDHRDSGLCHLHEKQRRLGAVLTAITSQHRTAETVEVPIESLQVGDRVSTYSNGTVYMNGREIVASTRFRYDGQLVNVATPSGLSSAYTNKHHCVVRFWPNTDQQVVYMMQRGDQFRIGRVPMFYRAQSGNFGLRLRAAAESADAAWILSVHDTAEDALLHEALAQHEYNIPGVCFNDHDHRIDVDVFWSKIGNNRDRAIDCLTAYGRLVEFPLVRSGERIGSKSPFVTAAANLLDGMMVLPFSNRAQWQGKRGFVAPRDRWEPVTVTREHYQAT